MTELLECYSNVTNSCPDWRDKVSGILNIEYFKTFMIGTCLNRNVLEDGITCLGSNREDLRVYLNQKCLTYLVWTNSERVTMQQYCSLMIIGIQCSVNKTQEFGCSDEFYDFLLHSSYIRLPVECLEPNSTKLKWLDMYTEIPTKLPESQNRKDKEEPNTTTDDTVSSATCNYMSHVSILTLNLIFHLLQAVYNNH